MALAVQLIKDRKALVESQNKAIAKVLTQNTTVKSRRGRFIVIDGEASGNKLTKRNEKIGALQARHVLQLEAFDASKNRQLRSAIGARK